MFNWSRIYRRYLATLAQVTAAWNSASVELVATTGWTLLFHAMAAHSKGDKQRVREIIKKHAEVIKNVPAAREYRQMDAMATARLAWPRSSSI